MTERADRHLTAAAEAIHDSAFCSQHDGRIPVADRTRQLTGATIVLTDLDGNDALTGCRYADLNGQQRRDTRSPFQASQARRGQHECIIVASIQFPEAGIKVASNRQEPVD